MNTIDPVKAAQVWQRVHAKPEEDPSVPRETGLLELIAREWEAAGTYLQLSRRYTGKTHAQFHKLFQREQAHTACLKGIYTLITGKKPTVAPAPPISGETHTYLRKCYGNSMQQLAQYEGRSGDPEYGHIFQRLAQQEKEHCHILLELLGNLK